MKTIKLLIIAVFLCLFTFAEISYKAGGHLQLNMVNEIATFAQFRGFTYVTFKKGPFYAVDGIDLNYKTATKATGTPGLDVVLKQMYFGAVFGKEMFDFRLGTGYDVSDYAYFFCRGKGLNGGYFTPLLGFVGPSINIAPPIPVEFNLAMNLAFMDYGPEIDETALVIHLKPMEDAKVGIDVNLEPYIYSLYTEDIKAGVYSAVKVLVGDKFHALLQFEDTDLAAAGTSSTFVAGVKVKKLAPVLDGITLEFGMPFTTNAKPAIYADVKLAKGPLYWMPVFHMSFTEEPDVNWSMRLGATFKGSHKGCKKHKCDGKGCGNPDCPKCGKKVEAPAPDTSADDIPEENTETGDAPAEDAAPADGQ